MKRFFCLFLCILLSLVLLSACSKEETTTTDLQEETTIAPVKEEKELQVTLGYYSQHSLNPFTTKSRTNKNISTLLYDSLFKTDNSFEAVAEIAQSYEVSDGDLIVHLRPDVLFTDGSELSAEDVVYSFNQAKNAPLYKAKLKNVSSARVHGESVIFTFSKKDIYAVQILDFPIVKYGSLSSESPIGSGRYILKGKNASYYLSRNTNYSLNEILEIKKIKLFDLNKTENPFYLLQIGDLSFIYDDFTAESLQYKIGASTAEVNLNNMVFLGFNKDSAVLGNSFVKKAVCLSVEKERICADVYDSLAEKSDFPFNPNWYALSDIALESDESTDSPATILDKSGYTYEYDTNEYRSKNFEYLTLTFLVSDGDEKKVKAAKKITDSLEKNGIDVDLQIIESDKFQDTLSKGEYDLYLGEVKLSDDMSLSSFFTKDAGLSYGIDTSSPAASAYFDFKEGKIDITTFVKVFNEYTPFLPICFRKGVCYYSRELKYEGTVSENDIFSNIYSWSN